MRCKLQLDNPLKLCVALNVCSWVTRETRDPHQMAGEVRIKLATKASPYYLLAQKSLEELTALLDEFKTDTEDTRNKLDDDYSALVGRLAFKLMNNQEQSND